MKLNFKFSFKKVMASVKARRASFEPDKDWKKIVIGSFVLIFASALFHTYIFYQIENETIFRASVDIQQNAIDLNMKELEDTFKFFDAKKERFSVISERGIETFDPSL